jgi:chemotaxis protein histidine kinase CheA
MTETLELTAAPVDVDKLDTAKPLEVIFAPFQTTLQKWESKVDSLKVTDISQKTEMAQARLARLELKDARVNMDKTRKGLVEHLKARTGKIDATARIIREKIEDLESRLLESEQFAERHAAKVKAELKVSRETSLREVNENPIIGDLSDLTEIQFVKLIEDSKILRQAKIDAATKAEEEKKAKEEADRLERARVAEELKRLKAQHEENVRREEELRKQQELERRRIEKEREEERKKVAAEKSESERLAKIERDRIEAERAEERRKAKAEADRAAEESRKKLEAEQKERRRVEAEAAKARAELEAKAKAEAEEKQRVELARREAAKAPDKSKVEAYLKSLRDVPIPHLKSIDIDIPMLLENFLQRIEIQAGLHKDSLL